MDGLLKKSSNIKSINNIIYKNSNDNNLVLLTLEKTNWTPETIVPINMLGGPIKILFNFVNNEEDKRNVFKLFLDNEYLKKNNINDDDLFKVAQLAIHDKLEKRLLAPKLISDLF